MSFNHPWTSRRRSVLLAALAAGLLLRLFFLWRYSRVTNDGLLYGDIAQNLLHHHIYGFSETLPNGHPQIRPTLIRLPGYPLFLAACFSAFGSGNFTAVMGVQVVLDLCTCLLLAATARRIFSPAAGTCALWLAVLCPFMANYVAAPLTETPTLFCMALAFYAFARWQQAGALLNRWILALGFALAWAVLLRPEQGLLAAAIVPAMLWTSFQPSFQPSFKPSFRPSFQPSQKPSLQPSFRPSQRQALIPKLSSLTPALAVAFLTILPLIPWTARNRHTFHIFQPLAPRNANDPGERIPVGFQRWFRTWGVDFASTDQAYWRYDGDTISIADLPNRAFDSNQQYAATAALLNVYNQATTATPALDARFAALADARIHADPLRYYLALPVARVLNMVFRPRVDFLPVPLEWWKFRQHPAATLFAGAYALLNLAYMLAAALAVFRRRWQPVWSSLVCAMLATIALRIAVLLTIDNSEPRYTLEFYPVLIILASLTLSGLTASKASL